VQPDPLPDSIAAVDLGSNSFHMVVARLVRGEPELVDRLRDQVQLASGLGEDRRMSRRVRRRALGTLERFRERLRGVPSAAMRAVGTNTFRRIKDGGAFRADAEAALGCPIEILSGREEARLIYLGVAHSVPQREGRQLVVDIGGGSTECIVGEGFDAQFVRSTQLGCVEFSQAYFPDGALKAGRFREAVLAARVELRDVERQVGPHVWSRVIGASGTIRAASQIARENGWSEGGLCRDGLDKIERALVDAGHVDKLDLPGLKPERASVLAGGICVLRAVYDGLGIDRMEVARGALREGILFDLLGRLRHEDVRDRTIERLQARYDVDRTQADRVQSTAREILGRVAKKWKLPAEESAPFLEWGAALHEIGLAISYVKHQAHGAYLIGEADLPGFSRDDRDVLAAVVGGHRGPVRAPLFRALPKRLARRARRLAAILRLAVRLRRGRSGVLPPFTIEAGHDRIRLDFTPGGLDAHPLLRKDLQKEATRLPALGVTLEF